MTPAEIVAEFRKKYENTYVFVQMPDSKEESLFFMDRIDAGGDGHGVMKLSSEEFGKIQLNIATAHTIKFAFPKVSVFQNGSDAYQFLREPRRQWQRGLCQGNCVVHSISQAISAGMVPARGTGLDFQTVAAAFAGKTFPYKKAMVMLGSGKYRSVALNDSFAITLSPVRTAHFVLSYALLPIALLGKGGEVIRVLEPAFERQIKEVVS